MSELNAKSFLIVAEQTPGEVVFKNYAELKEYLKRGLSVYATTEYSADNLEQAIYDREQLKGIKKKLTDKKKELEKAYTLPYEEVKNMLDDLINMVKEPLGRADEIIKECERQKKRNDIIAYAKRKIDTLGPDAVSVLKSPAFYNTRWLNVSYKMGVIQKEIDEKVERIRKDLNFVRTNGGENTPILLARYYETLSTEGLDKFLDTVKTESKKVVSPLNATVSLDAGESAPNEDIVCKTIRLWGTETQLESIISQLKRQGIRVEEIQKRIVASGKKLIVRSEISKEREEKNTLVVEVGDKVTICDVNTGETETYTIKETFYAMAPAGFSRGLNRDIIYRKEEAADNDILKNEIRSESPLAKMLVGKREGDVFGWTNAEGEKTEYKIVGIDKKG